MILRILCCAILQFCIIGYVFGVVPQITRLNVQCDRTGMKVNVEFDNPFNGIIFSKGHYSDPNCRWVPATSSRRQFNFYIGTSKCGTIGTDMSKDSTSPQGFKNVIIIQNDPDYQEVWDSARKLSCDWVTRLEKYVTFAPFGVDMLGVKELRFPGDTVDCWMDIQRGHGPFAPSVGGVVPIGEKLTVVIYVRDTDNSFDVHVKDCYAYDSSDYKNPDARAIKLTDERGCPVKEKLVQGFYRTRDVRTSGATIIAYGVINAFKFPERMDVFLACNVEVCKGSCPNNDCQPEVAVAGSGDEASPTTTAAPSTSGDEDKEEDDKEKETTDEDKTEGDGTSSTTEASTDTDTDDTEKADNAESGSGTATEETESSEDTSEKPSTDKEEETKDEMKKDEESKDEESKDEDSKDEESKDEEKKDEESKDEKKDEESKDEEKKESSAEDEKSDSDDKKDAAKEEKSEDTSTEKTDESESDSKKEESKDEDKEQSKESKTKSDDEEESDERRKAARIKLSRKSNRKAKKADVITPRKRSAKKPSRKGTSAAAKPKSSKLKKQASTKPVKAKKLKSTKPKAADLKAAPRGARLSQSKVRARIIRAPSSIPAAFSRQLRERNMAFDEMYQRQGRHIRSRRSVTVLSENATFPAMMHSISIISPIEDLDEKELNAWEKMMDLEGKAEKVSVFEAITKLPMVNGEGAYCFSMANLAAASALLAAIVMIISLSVAMVCSHLHARSSAKAVDLY